MHAARCDADLGAEAEFATIGELCRGIVQNNRRIDFRQEALGRRPILGHDRVGVMRAMPFDVLDRPIQPVDHATAQ